MTPRAPTVLFPAEWMQSFRIEFFTGLRAELAERGIRLEVIYGDPERPVAERRSSAPLDWGTYRENRLLPIGSRKLVWQRCTREAASSDLVVVDQGSRFLLNYWLLLQQRRGRARVAFWGHGENLNKPSASRFGERIKRQITRMPHWWFAYTEGSKQRVARLGYPPERITVIQNAGATISLRRLLSEMTPERGKELRGELGISDGPMGLFLGSLYGDKRLEYLIGAADEIASRRPDFSLVIAGDGPARDFVAAAIGSRPHVHWIGRAEGEHKAALLQAADVLMIPGAVGLAAVDGFVAGVPLVTTSVRTHGPEIEYVRTGENGLIVPLDATPGTYSEAVLSVLGNARALREGAAETGSTCSTEAMISRFASGIDRALAAEPLRREG